MFKGSLAPMKFGANDPWFVLSRMFDGDTTEIQAIDEVATFFAEFFSKLHPRFYGIFFVSFIENDPSTNFCGALTSFHKVMKLQSFEFNVCDFILANVQNISPWVPLHFFVTSMKGKLSTKLFLIIFHELMKFQSFERSNYVSM